MAVESIGKIVLNADSFYTDILEKKELADVCTEENVNKELHNGWMYEAGYTGALKAPVRCFGNHLSGKGKSSFQTDNECGGAAILKK